MHTFNSSKDADKGHKRWCHIVHLDMPTNDHFMPPVPLSRPVSCLTAVSTQPLQGCDNQSYPGARPKRFEKYAQNVLRLRKGLCLRREKGIGMCRCRCSFLDKIAFLVPKKSLKSVKFSKFKIIMQIFFLKLPQNCLKLKNFYAKNFLKLPQKFSKLKNLYAKYFLKLPQNISNWKIFEEIFSSCPKTSDIKNFLTSPQKFSQVTPKVLKVKNFRTKDFLKFSSYPKIFPMLPDIDFPSHWVSHVTGNCWRPTGRPQTKNQSNVLNCIQNYTK
jgi:hypothetical protein